MAKFAVLLLTCVLVGGCTDPDGSAPDSSQLQGDWVNTAARSRSFPALYFTDSSVVFDTFADTIYRFRYQYFSNQQQLVLTDMFGQTNTSKLLKVSADSLVADGLWDVAGVQRFKRVTARLQ